MKRIFCLLLCLVAAPALAYDVLGIRLGGAETEVKKAMPSANCKALEWKTNAADRRCDDARVPIARIDTRISVFLKAGTVQAYDVRFDAKELDRMKAFFKSQWGAPLAEATEVISRPNQPERKVFKMRWEKGTDRALFIVQLDKKRGVVEVSRGNFPTEIYQVR